MRKKSNKVEIGILEYPNHVEKLLTVLHLQLPGFPEFLGFSVRHDRVHNFLENKRRDKICRMKSNEIQLNSYIR